MEAILGVNLCTGYKCEAVGSLLESDGAIVRVARVFRVAHSS